MAETKLQRLLCISTEVQEHGWHLRGSVTILLEWEEGPDAH